MVVNFNKYDYFRILARYLYQYLKCILNYISYAR